MGFAQSARDNFFTFVLAAFSIALLVLFGHEILVVKAPFSDSALRIAERGRNHEALVLEDVLITPYPAAGGQTLILRGFVRNESVAPRPVPKLRMSLMRKGAARPLSASIVARALPDVCELDKTLQADAHQAATSQLLEDDPAIKAVGAHSRVPIFSYLCETGTAEEGGWVTVDWL